MVNNRGGKRGFPKPHGFAGNGAEEASRGSEIGRGGQGMFLKSQRSGVVFLKYYEKWSVSKEHEANQRKFS